MVLGSMVSGLTSQEWVEVKISSPAQLLVTTRLVTVGVVHFLCFRSHTRTMQARRGPKSSLTDHCFPRFYACYLLKSIRKPRSTASVVQQSQSQRRS